MLHLLYTSSVLTFINITITCISTCQMIEFNKCNALQNISYTCRLHTVAQLLGQLECPSSELIYPLQCPIHDHEEEGFLAWFQGSSARLLPDKWHASHDYHKHYFNSDLPFTCIFHNWVINTQTDLNCACIIFFLLAAFYQLLDYIQDRFRKVHTT